MIRTLAGLALVGLLRGLALAASLTWAALAWVLELPGRALAAVGRYVVRAEAFLRSLPALRQHFADLDRRRVEAARGRVLAEVVAAVERGESVSTWVVAEQLGGHQHVVDLVRSGGAACRWSRSGERVLVRAGLPSDLPAAWIPDPLPEWRDDDALTRGEGIVEPARRPSTSTR